MSIWIWIVQILVDIRTITHPFETLKMAEEQRCKTINHSVVVITGFCHYHHGSDHEI
jgi:hypothetical protein